MENKFTLEQIEKAKACKNVEELIALAKENGVTNTEAEAKNYFAQLNPTNGELSDSELETVSGGCGDSDEGESKGRTCPNCGASADNLVPAETETIVPTGGIKTPNTIKPIRLRCIKCNNTFRP